MSPLSAYFLTKLRVPLGRVIGDNNCSYSAFDVCAVRLEDSDGLNGWGFGEAAHGGTFRKPVSWKAEMATARELEAMLASAWAGLRGRSPQELLESLPRPWEAWNAPRYLLAAVRMALWDLTARQRGKPLHEVLRGGEGPDSLTGYASPCCFPQPTEWVVDFFQAKVAGGFRAVKVKVGHPDIEWDMARLRAVREAVGPEVMVAVDGNTAWDGPGAIRWMERTLQKGLNIAYVEDPVWPEDLEAFRQLAREAPLPVVGHDYVPDPGRQRPLLDTGALRAIRMRDGIDHAIAAARLAEEYDLALIGCNTFGEHGLHFSLTHPRVERIEFADLGWNALFENPVRAEKGKLVVPPGPGLGLVPRADRLEEWKVEEEVR